MAILLPFIRLCLLTSNIWITYKRLKRTRTPRNGERNSRYLQARKRDLKSVLQVWMLWGIASAIEPVFDSSISFLPFYAHIKALLWFILLITRSILAEPIYTHFLRPFIKPYVITIDLILDLIHAVGELLLEIILMPFHYSRRFWKSWRSPEEPATHTGDSLDHEAPIEEPGRPVTRSRARDAEVVGIASGQSSIRQTRSQTVLKRKPSAQSVRSMRNNTTGGVRSSVVIQPSDSRPTFQFVDPQTLNLDNETQGVRLRKKRSSLKEIDRNTPTELEAGIQDNGISLKETPNELEVPLPVPRSHSDSAVPAATQSHPPPDPATPWSGLYPPLPAAYPASPLPPRPVSLPPLHSSEPTYTIPGEPYPAFPSAYPVTPAVRPLSLHPNFSVGASGHLFASMAAQMENMSEEQEVEGVQTAMVEAVPGSVEESAPDSRVTTAALRQALAPIGEKRAPRRARIVSTSDMQPKKVAKSSDTRRLVSTTMTAAIHLAASDEQVQNTTQIQPDTDSHYKTKSHVPQKRSIRGEATASGTLRGRRETASRHASTSKATEPAAAVIDDDDVSIKRRKVSREASSDSFRTSRESSQDRNNLTKTRGRVQQTAQDERTTRPGAGYLSRASTFSAGSRRTRATASAAASASEAYQTSRRRAT